METTDKERIEMEILQLRLRNEQLQSDKLTEELKVLRKPWWRSLNWIAIAGLFLAASSVYVTHFLTQIRIDGMQRAANEVIQTADERKHEAEDQIRIAQAAAQESNETIAAARAEYESIQAKIQVAKDEQARTNQRIETRLAKAERQIFSGVHVVSGGGNIVNASGPGPHVLGAAVGNLSIKSGCPQRK